MSLLAAGIISMCCSCKSTKKADNDTETMVAVGPEFNADSA